MENRQCQKFSGMNKKKAYYYTKMVICIFLLSWAHGAASWAQDTIKTRSYKNNEMLQHIFIHTLYTLIS